MGCLFKDILFALNSVQDSLKSASEVKIFRNICDTEKKDYRNHIGLNFYK